MAAFAPDSKWLALCLNEYEPQAGVLKLCAADGTERAELARAKGKVFYKPKVSPNGKRLVVEQSKGRIDQPAALRVWDLETQKELFAFPSGGAFPFADFAFSPDSKRLAATDYRGTVRVWDLTAGKLLREKSFGKRMGIWNVAFSSDGKRLAVGGQPKEDQADDPEPEPQDLPQPRVFLFDLAAAAADPEVIVCPQGYLGGLGLSPDGKWLAAGGAGATHLFDLTTHESSPR